MENEKKSANKMFAEWSEEKEERKENERKMKKKREEERKENEEKMWIKCLLNGLEKIIKKLVKCYKWLICIFLYFITPLGLKYILDCKKNSFVKVKMWLFRAEIFFYTKLHPMQGSRATQDRGFTIKIVTMNAVYDINGREGMRKWWGKITNDPKQNFMWGDKIQSRSYISQEIILHVTYWLIDKHPNFNQVTCFIETNLNSATWILFRIYISFWDRHWQQEFIQAMCVIFLLYRPICRMLFTQVSISCCFILFLTGFCIFFPGKWHTWHQFIFKNVHLCIQGKCSRKHSHRSLWSLRKLWFHKKICGPSIHEFLLSNSLIGVIHEKNISS